MEVGDDRGRTEGRGADLLAMGGGWTPAIHLSCHLGGKPRWDEALTAFLPGTTPPGMSVAGAAAGRFTTAAALADGAREGAAAARDCGFAATEPQLPRAEDTPDARVALFHVPAYRGKAFVDFQHDVTAKDVALAHREGFRSVEHVKRYTRSAWRRIRAGRRTSPASPSWRRLPDAASLAPAPRCSARPGRRSRSVLSRDTTAARPSGPRGARRPTAGRTNGATFVEVGPWLRAQWYARPGETDWQQSMAREVAAVRSHVGICDVSTLGKIEGTGLGAARVRYEVMLREDGFVMDDGTVARIAEGRFFVTTTTANAGKVLRPDLDVSMISVTDAWAQVSVAGTRAREVVTALADPGPDLSNASLPHMAWCAVSFGGVPARLYRLSFSGELAYELGVPPDLGAALMRRAVELGATPYGTEALAVLRVEKGHPAGGELNGQTTARDLGRGRSWWVLSRWMAGGRCGPGPTSSRRGRSR